MAGSERRAKQMALITSRHFSFVFVLLCPVVIRQLLRALHFDYTQMGTNEPLMYLAGAVLQGTALPEPESDIDRPRFGYPPNDRRRV